MAAVDFPYPKAVERFPELRQSTLSAFDNCGLSAAFDMQYRQGWNTAPQGRGQMFHRFAAECLREMYRLRENSIPVDAALSILGDVLRQDDADRVCPRCGSEEIEPGVDARGRRTCSNGHKFPTELVNVSTEQIRDLYWVVVKWAHENTFDINLLVDVEQRLKGTLHYPNRVTGGTVPRTLTGQIDALLVDETATHAIVIDWKDMWALPTARPEGTDDGVSWKGYFQQRYYAWLVFKNYPSIERVTLREFYVRYSEPREASVTRMLEEEIERELASLAERFDRAFDTKPASVVPTPGKHCSYCMLPQRCTIPKEAREEGRVVSEDEAVRLTWQIQVAEQVNKAARKAASAWAELHGPIPAPTAKEPTRMMGFVPETRTKRPDFEAIEQAEREVGRSLNAVEIKALYRTTQGTRFKFFAPAPVDEAALAASDAEIEEKLRQSIAAATEKDAEPKRHLQAVPDADAA